MGYVSQTRTIKFIDQDSGQAGFVAVRTEDEVVGLALSLEANGDIEVFLDSSQVAALIQALEQAVSAAQ